MNSRFSPRRALLVRLCVLAYCINALPTQPASANFDSPFARPGQRTLRNDPASPFAKRPAREIIDDAFTAFGGIEKFKRAKERSYRARGKVVVTSGISGGVNSFDCDMLGKKDKMRVETTVLGQKTVSAYDGTISWSQTGDWVSKNSPTATQRIAEEVKHGFEALLDSLTSGADVESLEPKKVGGSMCEVVRLNYKQGPTTIYFDPASHLVARSEFTGDDPEQGHSVVKGFEYSNYKPVEDIPTPFITTEYSDDKKISETILESIDTSTELPDSVFAMPPESSIAALEQRPVRIPFEYAENEILIKLHIKDKEYSFLVDTGASTSVIDKKLAQTLGASEASTFTITTGGQSLPLTYLTVPALTIGEITLNDISTLVTDLGSLGLNAKVQPSGIVGANILKRFLVTFDYQNRQLVLADPTRVEVPANAVAIPTSPAFGSTALVVPGKLNGTKTVNFLVDTGAAFNNLPPALARNFYTGPLLQVGKIAGMDGNAMSMSSLQLDSLQLGSLIIDKPVFATVPSGSAPAGLVNASSMGILGNPLWSQYRITLDYRNEQLILESPPGKKFLDETSARLAKIYVQFLHDKNIDTAETGYAKVMAAAKDAHSLDGQALAASYLAGTFNERFLRNRDRQTWDVAASRFHDAADLAAESRNPRIQARVLADWALIYLNEPDASGSAASHLPSAHKLLVRALELSPLEPSVYAVLGKASHRIGQDLVAEKVLDQALLLDPGNWLALWTKLHILEKLKQPEVPLVVAQLKRYYGDVAEVADLK